MASKYAAWLSADRSPVDESRPRSQESVLQMRDTVGVVCPNNRHDLSV